MLSLDTQGKVNLEQEVAKIQKKVDVAQGTASKMRSAQEQPDYSTKIPQAVRDTNDERVRFGFSSRFFQANKRLEGIC